MFLGGEQEGRRLKIGEEREGKARRERKKSAEYKVRGDRPGSQGSLFRPSRELRCLFRKL